MAYTRIVPESALIDQGEFAGWETLPREPFDNHVGPFFHRREPDGTAVCRFRAEIKNTNALGLVHGGCLLTFADYCLFIAALTETGGREVITVSMGSEFVGGARAGDLVEARGEVIRAGKSLIFARGVLSVDARPVLMVSGTMKRMNEKSS
jgi:uncharacterized protein (TIGR00369 family)